MPLCCVWCQDVVNFTMACISSNQRYTPHPCCVLAPRYSMPAQMADSLPCHQSHHHYQITQSSHLVTKAIKPTMEAKPLNSTAQALSTAGQSSNTCPPATSKQHHIYASNPCTAWSSTLWCGVAHHRAPCFDIAFQCCNLGCSTAAALMNEWMSHA
jgi:hypothetical protein